MKILYVGALAAWSTSEARVRALSALGHEVVPLDTTPLLERGPALLRKIQRQLLVGAGVSHLNAAVLNAARLERPDLLWVDQGIYLWPRTAHALGRASGLLLHYNSDYLRFHPHVFRHYLASVPAYEVHVVTNELCVPMLQQRAARRVVLAEFGYDPQVHRPQSLTEQEMRHYGSDAFFGGHWEPTTERLVAALLACGVRVRVSGGGWGRARAPRVRARLGGDIQPRLLPGDEYVKYLAATKLGLGIVSKWNRSESASRTFEIPAVGGFLLGERTADHQRYYREGEEAEFFADEWELVDKALCSLQHDQRRREIARAGYERAQRSGYRHQDRMRQLLQAIGIEPRAGTVAW